MIEQGNSEDVYLKVVDHAEEDQTSEGTMIAWAHWIPPEDENRPISSGALPGPPPWGLNRAFCGKAVNGTEDLRTRVLKGRKSYGMSYDKWINRCSTLQVLNQLVTLPEHQRRGAGGMLLTWPVERAAKEGIVCYLDTELDGEVVKMYEKREFVVVDRLHIDLKSCGIDGDTYTHVAMIKEPANSGENEMGGKRNV